jgi:ABC-type multidrug transport system ATPase subunit
MNIDIKDKPILSWNNISYSVPNLNILKSVNGYAIGGRLLSIMGSSGSGKTTFLDVLCDRTKGGNLNCNICLNGINVTNHRSKLFSYVTQDDQLLNSATVRETLTFAALLRVSNIDEDVLNKRVDTVLNDLGIMHRADSLIGGGEIKGLSGGEKRRVSIGQELVCTTSPLICLDEPTTGLDSFTALNVMTCINDLSKKNNVIVLATIHQPNSNISALFDDLMLMSHGDCVYFGRFNDAVDRFSKVGLTCPIYNNPCDFFITIIDNDTNSQLLVASQNNWFQTLCNENYNNDSIDSENHELLYIKMLQNNKNELSLINNEINNNHTHKEDEVYATSFMHQSKILTIRSWRQWIRDPGNIYLSISYIYLLYIYITSILTILHIYLSIYH